MLYWTLVFLVVAMVAARYSASPAFTSRLLASRRSCSLIFLVLFVVSLLAGGMNRRDSVTDKRRPDASPQGDRGPRIFARDSRASCFALTG